MSNQIPTAQLALYEKLVATIPDVGLKGKAMPYTSCNGHMFSFLTKEGTLALRLPAEEREAFLKKHRTRLCEQHGTIMKEYVEVPAALLRKTPMMADYFQTSFEYVNSLKPKPTRRKKQTASGSKKTAKKKPVAKKKQDAVKVPKKKKVSATRATKSTAKKKVTSKPKKK